ncbi:hypothetical protein NVSP9465_04396 [Novosphingobium sp. CECT 9465]|nr:hypothetical protein [Novosphingobium sp. CECT 9465]CAH0499296.1 hypothetical protein NVSP9465_04396 [Novosphingobium sp. CECT 9465]
MNVDACSGLYHWTPDQSVKPDPFADAEGAQDQQPSGSPGIIPMSAGGWVETESSDRQIPADLDGPLSVVRTFGTTRGVN